MVRGLTAPGRIRGTGTEHGKTPRLDSRRNAPGLAPPVLAEQEVTANQGATVEPTALGL